MSDYTTDEILRVIEEHGKLELPGADLSGIDLSDETIRAKREEWEGEGEPPWWAADLRGAALGNANLVGTYLWGANLQRANLEGAKLQGAKLREANLRGANLGLASLHEADLGFANLERAYLGAANLQGANLGEANLQGTYLMEANLEDANLRGANLDRADLERANLEGADLRGAHFHPSVLQGAYFTGAKRDWQAILVTEGMLEVTFALTGIASALAGVFASIGSFSLSLTVVLLFAISLSAVGSLILYLTYLNQQGVSLGFRGIVLSPYGWLLLSSGGIWVVAAALILQRLLEKLMGG